MCIIKFMIFIVVVLLISITYGLVSYFYYTSYTKSRPYRSTTLTNPYRSTTLTSSYTPSYDYNTANYNEIFSTKLESEDREIVGTNEGTSKSSNIANYNEIFSTKLESEDREIVGTNEQYRKKMQDHKEYNTIYINDDIVVEDNDKKVQICINVPTSEQKLGSKEVTDSTLPVHSWYKYNNMSDLMKDKKVYEQYLEDRYIGQSHFLYDWDEVLKVVKPILHKSMEYIGIIKAKDDKKTLYVDSMDPSPETDVKFLEKNEIIRISSDISNKYKNVPCYFIFHTHPISELIDPFPSGTDIVIAIERSYGGYGVGDVLISEYGVIVYYLKQDMIDKQCKYHKELIMNTYIYNVLAAWESCKSMKNFHISKRIKTIKKFGLTMAILPTPYFIDQDMFVTYNSDMPYARIRNADHEFLNEIKYIIDDIKKEYEKRDQKGKNRQGNKLIKNKKSYRKKNVK